MKKSIICALACLPFLSNAQCNGNEPIVNLGNDTILCQGQSLVLNAPTGYDYFQWSTGAFSNQLNVTAPGTYGVAAGIVGANVILNGDFQNGTTAAANNFTAAYIPGTGGSWGVLSNPGQYAISTAPSLVHSNFLNCGDHTTGTGNMYVANGASTPNTIAWSQTVNVTPNTDYVFSFWQMNVLNAVETSNLQLYINTVPISAIVPTSTSGCVWQENTGFWNSGAATQAVLSIVNQSTLSSGNDFAIDDIYFAPVCIVEDSIVVSYDTTQVDAGPDITFCANESETVIASANDVIMSWSWSNGTPSLVFTPTASGTYTVTGTTVNGCVVTDDMVATIIAMDWQIDTLIMGPAACGSNDGYVSVLTTGTFADPPSYEWSGPGNPSSSFINASVWTDLSPGWYYLSIESNGCYITDSLQVLPANPPVAIVAAAPASGTYPLTVTLDNTSQNATDYEWDFGNGNTLTTANQQSQIQTYDTTGVYTVMLVANFANCSDTTYVLIVVNDPPPPPVIPPVVPVDISAPNVFTPNNDGINDVFLLNMLNIKEVELTILNRWGNLLHSGKGINASWDGKSIEGQPAMDGVYFYRYTATGMQGEAFEGHGFVHLIR
jgi:gliding motility-associated-like protein